MAYNVLRLDEVADFEIQMFNKAQKMIKEQKPNNSTETAILSMQCSTLFNCFSDAIRAMEDELDWQYFTVGKNGKKPYHFWTVGKCGCYYALRCMPSGHAGAKRQIEEKMIFKVFHK